MNKRKGRQVALLGALGLPVQVGLVVNWITPYNPVSAILRYSGRLVSFLAHPVTLRLWVVIIVPLSALGLAAATAALLRSHRSRTDDFHSYTSDTILGMKWDWQFAGETVVDLVPLCPECDCELDIREDEFALVDVPFALVCPRCKIKKEFDSDWPTLLGKVLREIRRRIRDGKYKQEISAK